LQDNVALAKPKVRAIAGFFRFLRKALTLKALPEMGIAGAGTALRQKMQKMQNRAHRGNSNLLHVIEITSLNCD